MAQSFGSGSGSSSSSRNTAFHPGLSVIVCVLHCAGHKGRLNIEAGGILGVQELRGHPTRALELFKEGIPLSRNPGDAPKQTIGPFVSARRPMRKRNYIDCRILTISAMAPFTGIGASFW